MSGENCLLTADGYGTRRVTVEGLSFGMEVVAGQPDEARRFRTFYISKVTKTQFELGLVFTDHGDYEDFANWLKGYGEQAQTPGTPVGAMRATIPARGFDRIGVPTNGITYGQSVGEASWRMSLMFTGARDLTDTTGLASTFARADRGAESIYFYPAGVQGSEGNSLDVSDQLYNSIDQPLQVFRVPGSSVRVE